VTARSSEGFFAPWITQFFYYAINGVTDDIGWQGSHWGGKPIWLELTLKEPADIGRVVLYAPNLGDYSIDLIGPDGGAQRIDVTGNTSKLTTHRLAHTVRCLKLRVTATKVAGGVPTVSEIEAYADAGEGPTTPLLTVLAAAGPAPQPMFGATAEPNALWDEHFEPFGTAPKYNWDGKDTNWVLDPAKLLAEPRPGGGLVLASRAAEGYAGMTHLFPIDPAHRFFQVNIAAIDGTGYKYAYVHCGTSSGEPGYRSWINCNRPGIYTVDTHYIHDNYRTGAEKSCFVVVSAAGSAKQADGGVTVGPRFTFDWIRLVQEPLDGLAVTLPDGAPLGDSVKVGDTLRFELRLTRPAADAVVEVQCDSSLTPLPINGEPYVQLRRADEAGKVWVGEVTLGPRTGKFKPTGYPTIFKAAVNGGAIKETYAPVMTAFE
ncbi:MAG: hypothetical protein HYU66_20025, partial [Armatimonadetes bacterium]|nr:hypothetical protein [Armatimonadota bacterium]